MCHVYAKGRGLAAHTDLSITRDVRGGGCKICTPLPSTQLTLRSGSSKLDCTGLKIDPFHYLLGLHSCVWAHFKVEEPCNSVTERHFDFYC